MELIVTQKVCKASHWHGVSRPAGLGLAIVLIMFTKASAGLAPVAPGPSALPSAPAYHGDIVSRKSVPFAANYTSRSEFAVFPGFATDPFDLPFEPMAARRSANVSGLRPFANSPGPGAAPELAVTVSGTDVFLLNGPRGLSVADPWDRVSFRGAFRPMGLVDDGGSTAVAVPLPPAFYTGLGVMMACGVITLLRRLLGS
jgi:hypothetical protein